MAVKITIPVDFQDSAQSYKKIIASLQSELKKVKPGTTIYENISSQLKKANSLILKLEGNIGQGVASHAEIERIIKDFSSLQTVVESVNDAYATMSIKNLNINSENFGDLAKDLVEAASQLAEAKKALSNAENLSIGELFQGDANIGKFTAKQLTSKGKGFYDSLAAQIERLGIKSNEAEQEVKTLEQSLLDLQQQANNLKSNSLAESIAEIVGTAGSKTSKKGQFVSIEEAQTNLLNTTQNKFFTKKGSLKAGVSQDQVEEWLKAFGISDESIAKILETSKDRIERLRQAINTEFTNSKKNQVVAQYRDAAAESIQRQAVEKQIAEVNANLKTARSTANDYSGELKGIQEQFNLLKDKLIRRGILGATEGEAGDLQKQINAIEQQMASLQSAIVAQGPKAENNLPDTPSREATDQAFNAEHDAQQFKDNLKQAISHWLSAQMIITKVREGIHQAWTDIQGLDKAMTNIAVVTDMSVSDLWGKIDQYMAIAQEYGVTTQGVYEVSQLYYQQGLSASEVMEATTETLKMARIAGMDYKDAADAMTVAIRAFKMEMSDAQIITDVYSKVAAVTASDSQELAIAMSKTASSAESVGSSFENTTAMLAVMIETTRESAQNLGSALKSIISRYGEMKVGMTVDSEGEEIDYNKVDTALKSIGISIKDAQGQFRDFDDVIFELSQKWDTLDKNTQRYIATIMAGNRQQSRFIALVDSGDRLKEVMDAAHNSADAGLLQYAKTLDSLETKLNALSTSFQQFYMNIVNGDTFKQLIDLVTNVLNGLNKIGTSATVLTSITLVKIIKIFSAFVLNNFSSLFSDIRKNYKQLQEDLTTLARAGAEERKAIEEGNQPRRRTQARQLVDQQKISNRINTGINALNIGGAVVSTIGLGLAGSGRESWGSALTAVGNTTSMAGTGAALGKAIGTIFGGPVVGAIIGAFAAGIPTLLSGLSDWFDILDRGLELEIEKAKEKAQEKNLERATAAEEERNLKTTIENLKKLQKARYQSAEAEQAYIDASKEALAAFPALEAQFSSSGDVWIDVLSNTSNAEELLAQAREKTRKATLEATAAEREQAVKQQEKAEKDLEETLKVAVDGLFSGITSGIIEDGYFNSDIHQKAVDANNSGYFKTLEDIFNFIDNLGLSDEDESLLKGATLKNIRLHSSDPQEYYNKTDEEIIQIYSGKINTARATLTKTQQGVAATDRASIISFLDGKENLSTSQKDLLAEWIYQNKTEADFTDNNFVPTDNLAKGIADYELAVSYFTKEQTEEFDKVIEASQKGTMTSGEVKSSLEHIFNNVLPQAVSDWLEQYGLNLEQQIYNFSGTLVGQDIGKLLPSGETFLLLDGYANLISLIPDTYHSIISEYNKHLQANVDADNLKIDEASSSMTELLYLMAEASNEELALIGQSGTDITSYTGLYNFIEVLKKSGISDERIAKWQNFQPAVMNFTTEWGSFRKTATKQLQLFSDKLSEATKGLDLEDAEKLASQIGADLGTDFELKGEKYYLTNIKLLEEKYLEPVRALQQKILDAATEAKVGKSLEEQSAIDAEAQKALSGLEQYEKNLLFKFYLTNGLFSEALDKIGFTEEEGNLKNEILKYLKTGDVSQLSEEAIQKISPYLNIINEAIVDSLKNVWSEVANSFGTTNVFTANDTNKHIWEELQNFGIVTKIGEDLFKMNSDISEDSINYALGSANLDIATKNSFYSQWQEYKQKSVNILSEVAANPEKIDYSTISNLATKIGQDANLVAERFFEKQIDGTYKITQNGLEQLLGFLGSDASLNPEKDYYRTLYEVYSTKLQEDKKSFLQGLDQNATIDDLMEAHERGWLTVTPEIIKNIREGSTSVYDVLRNAFANEVDFQIGNTIRIDDITTELNNTFNSLLSDLTSASVEDLRNLHYKATGVEANAGETYAYFNAIQQAKDGNVELLRQYIISLAQQASLKGLDIDFQIINNTLTDTAQQLASEILGNLESAIEGTLSAANMHDLSQKLNIDVERYAQATIDGYKVTTDGMLKLGTEMMKQYGETYGVAEKMFDLFVGESGVYKGYRYIVKAAVELDKTADKTTAEYKAQKKLLTDMAKIAMFNPDDPLFNFMDQDPSRGMALTAQSMVDSIDKVKDAFETLKDGENIAATDFYNMMDFMYNQLGSWDNFANALGISDATLAKLKISTTEGANIYEQFVNAIVSNSKILGEVDADVLMKLGLSAKNMSKGMSESLKAVADDQIKQLEAMKATLLAMKELENLDIDLGLGINFGDQEAQLFNFANFLGLGQDEDLIKAVNEKLEDIKSEFFKTNSTRIGLTQDDWEKIFGADGIVNAENEQEIIAAQNIGKFFNFLKGITEQEATEFARRLDALDESGKIDMSKLLTQIVETDDWTQFAKGLSADIQAAIDTAVGQINEIEVNANGKYKLKDNQKFTDDIAQQIRDIYAANGYQAIEVGMNGEEIEVHIIDAKVKAMIDASRIAEDAIDWQYDFNSQTYKATVNTGTMDVQVAIDKFGSVTYTDSNGKPVTSDTVDEMLSNSGLNIKKTADGENQKMQLELTAPVETVDATTTIAENVAGIKAILDEGIVISVTDDATGKLETIEETYIRLADTLAARPLIISTTGSTLTGITSTNNQNEGEEQKTLPTLEQKIKINWEGLDDWKQEELTQSVKVNYTNIGSWKRYNQTQDVTVNYTVGTVENPNLNSSNNSSSSNTQNQNKKPKDTGAKGNVNLLKLGAAYARGTLMGELGPELYVQKGAYHIAGANGPEFIDLDPDAIVFNHLQTANLLGKGHTSKTGSPVISERRSVAFATGNVSGPAMASGIDSAIEAIDRAIAMWQNIANVSTKELLNGSGKHKGGGSGNTLKAVTEELQEWYNLSRQIADIEQDINNLLAERENIEWSNGEAYLKSLREQQKLLNQQITTQQALLDYQELQLKRQAQHINQNRIWSQFLTVGEDGLLQYIEGNETNGGKGALQVLQELNQMSGEQQTAYLKRLGYSYTNNDGKKLEGQELVEQFFKELQDQIDQYDSLYDTVHGTEETLEKLRNEIKDINEQIKENQMDLEEAVFDIIVSAWEKEIEQMEEQADLIKEANEAYINGLNNALSAERQMYDDNQKVADREQLQRQLSLLRRSGGSASEIANLEEQLDDMLKDEYFNNQEQMIEDIRQANDIQVQQLDTQIRLQQEALEYQKENGVIWTQVYEVLSQSREEILDFMQGNSTEFFSQSLLQQEQMLTEWAHKIGIYKEDQKYQNYVNHAKTNIWDNGQIWNLGNTSKYQDVYAQMSEDERNTLRDQFTSVYAQARLDGKDHNTAAQEAAEAVSNTLKRKQDAINSYNNTPPSTTPNPQNPGGGGNSGGSSSSSGSSSGSSGKPSSGNSSSSSTGGTQTNTPPYTIYDNDRNSYGTFTSFTTAATAAQSVADKTRGKVVILDKNGKTVGTYMPKSNGSSSSSSSSNTNYNPDPSGHEVANGQGTGWHFHINKDGKAVFKSAAYQTREQATAAAKSKLKDYPGHKYSTKYYMHGGLVDYTGLAMVHGSKTEPESFLNAEQTAQIREGLEITSGKSSVLEGVKDTLLKLNSSIQSLTNITNKTESNTYTIAPGAVVIQVEQLNDAYDVDTLSADIMNRIYAIGNKSTNRGVSRR